jgi:hypothetical protein
MQRTGNNEADFAFITSPYFLAERAGNCAAGPEASSQGKPEERAVSLYLAARRLITFYEQSSGEEHVQSKDFRNRIGRNLGAGITSAVLRLGAVVGVLTFMPK